MKKVAICTTLAVALVALSGCNKKLKPFESNFFNTVPTPLETVGENVPANINGKIPAKFMVKNARVTATPVLVYGDKESASQPIEFQGENVRANGQVISYVEGGNIIIPFKVAYENGMETSDLYLDFNVNQNDKLYNLPRVKVGYGLITTSTLASAATVAPAFAKDNFQKVITENYSADIHFLINQANIRASQTDKPDYIDLNKRLIEASKDKNQEISGLTVNSYASPEGNYEFNERLAQQREKNTTSLIEKQLKKDNITEFGELTASFTPEDWEGFKTLVEKSNIQDKDLILSVLSIYQDPVQREKEIRNMSVVFNELAEQILPQLRYSRVMATIKVIGKSDSEIYDLFNTDPSKLTVDEMLYLATLTDDNARKMDIYKKATTLFPDDYRTFNNLGATQFIAGDYNAAAQNFNRAAAINPTAKPVELNQGLISLLNKNYDKANEQIGAAAGLPETADALGVYYLTQGDVSKAINAFSYAKTNNAALARILAKDYTGAKNILSSISTPDATTYYLIAIVGARENNESMVMSNLRQAVKLDPSYAQRAKKDLEFRNYNLATL